MAGERFEIEPEEAYREPRQGSGCLRGCLFVLAIFAILVILFAIVAAFQWRSWFASFATTVIQQSLNASSLPPQEKIEVQQELGRVLDAFKANEISVVQFGDIIRALLESPLMNSMVVSVVEEQYLNRSGLDAEEIQAGRTVLKRFVTGMFEEEINEAAIDSVISHLADRQPNGTWVFRNQVSDQDLRAMLTAAKREADAAGVPDTVEEVDPSEEVRRVINGVLGLVPPPKP